MVPLHQGGQKPFSASKRLKIEVLRGAKPKTSATKKTGGFHLAKKNLLKASSSLSEGTAQTVCIERGSAAVSGDAIVCLTALIWAHLPAGKVFFLLPPSAHHRRFLAGKHVGGSFYIFIKSDANVCSGWHIFMFSSPIAPGCLFQVLLRTGY